MKVILKVFSIYSFEDKVRSNKGGRYLINIEFGEVLLILLILSLFLALEAK